MKKQMRNTVKPLAGVLSATLLVALTAANADPAQPWQAPYAGTDATAANVIGLWHFDEGATGSDASGKGHELVLRGNDTRQTSNGKFGGAMLVEEMNDLGDRAQGAQTKDADDLTPSGAFTVELWFAPDAKTFEQPASPLVDKKNVHYVSTNAHANDDYALVLNKAAGGKLVLTGHFGFGTSSEKVTSSPQIIEAGTWHHAALTYDGVGGAKIYLDGAQIGQAQFSGHGAVSNGSHALVIGARIGSLHQRFCGRIDEVRISSGATRYASGRVLVNDVASRHAFYRGESAAKLQLHVVNDTLWPLQNTRVLVQATGAVDITHPLPLLAAGESTPVTISLPTSLRPARYALSIQVENSQKKS
jgi:hypothetical protein